LTSEAAPIYHSPRWGEAKSVLERSFGLHSRKTNLLSFMISARCRLTAPFHHTHESMPLHMIQMFAENFLVPSDWHDVLTANPSGGNQENVQG